MHAKPKFFYETLPKIELHRHLEGSLRLETLIEIASHHDLDLPVQDSDRFRRLVQVMPNESHTVGNFLSKFKTIRLFFISRAVIQRFTREAIEDAAADNVRYLELRFTPVALSGGGRFSLGEVMDWVVDSAQEAASNTGVLTNLVASTNRHESPKLAQQVAELAVERISDGIIGLDLAGDEVNFPAAPFVGIFKEARQAGLHTTMHAGEWSGAENVKQAMEVFHTERIGHGVQVMDDPLVVGLARERGTVFEVCVTSNLQSGVVSQMSEHPLPAMIRAGLKVTLNTDDPGVSDLTLGGEYAVACERLRLSVDELRTCVIEAAQGAFLSTSERDQLVKDMLDEFPTQDPSLGE